VLSGEIRALGDIAGKATARPTDVARDVHAAVTRRVFGMLGPLGMPVRALHDPLSRASYTAVAAALRAPLSAGALFAATRVRATSTSLADSPGGALALGAVNGVVGDRLATKHPDLAVAFTFRERGREVKLTREALSSAHPDATSRIAVFIHGLCETEGAWASPYPGATPRPTYGERLRSELGINPVYVRYNTGLHISDNGRALVTALDDLVAAWPTPVASIALVGHSMGGLVARSACHYAGTEQRDAASKIRHVVCLGTPHLGAPLEKAANVAGWPLSRLPETRPFADLFLNGRSAGIKDLRFGSCLQDDWCDCDPDEFLRDRCQEFPFLESASYCFVGATLSSTPDGAGGMFGDLLVTYRSASGDGRRRRIPFEVDNGHHIGRIDHLRLLNHPAVYERLRTWLGGEPTQPDSDSGPAPVPTGARDGGRAPHRRSSASL
jgi:pimeloyl-ACP methyl ester carboxylesterase